MEWSTSRISPRSLTRLLPSSELNSCVDARAVARYDLVAQASRLFRARQARRLHDVAQFCRHQEFVDMQYAGSYSLPYLLIGKVIADQSMLSTPAVRRHETDDE